MIAAYFDLQQKVFPFFEALFIFYSDFSTARINVEVPAALSWERIYDISIKRVLIVCWHLHY